MSEPHAHYENIDGSPYRGYGHSDPCDRTCIHPDYPSNAAVRLYGSYNAAIGRPDVSVPSDGTACAVPRDCECQYAYDGRVVYADSDCRGHCVSLCHCGADNHPGHTCVDPVTLTDPGHTDNRPCHACGVTAHAKAKNHSFQNMVSYKIGPVCHTHGYDEYAGRAD